MSIDAILNEFKDLLAVRLEKGVYTTEDSVRYTFFAAMISAGEISPDDIVMEYPHPTISRAKIDTFVPDFAGGTLAIEFKYDRQIPSGSNMPRPQKAGSLFRDVARLSAIDASDRQNLLFVYLTDGEMRTYLSKPSNGLKDFFGLEPGDSLKIDGEYLGSKSATLQGAAGEVSASIACLLSQAMPRDHALRVYEVDPLSV